MIDSFLEFCHGIRKNCWRLLKFHITEGKKEGVAENRMIKLEKFLSVHNTVKAMKVRVAFITSGSF